MKEMRQKNREITDRKLIDEIIRKSGVLYLAMADGNVPYGVPLSFGYDGCSIYFHCASEGLKIDFIKKNPNVCFTFVGEIVYQEKMSSCDAGTAFQSVIGRGKCEILSDVEEKRKGLDILMCQYTKSKLEFSEKAIQGVTIVKISITELKGKRRLGHKTS